MCLSLYDLICDECRVKIDKIYGDKDLDIHEEIQLLEETINSLCDVCLEMAKEEGFIKLEITSKELREMETFDLGMCYILLYEKDIIFITLNANYNGEYNIDIGEKINGLSLKRYSY